MEPLTPRQLELDLYPRLKPGQVVKILGKDFTGHFDLVGFYGIIEGCNISCNIGISVWVLGFKFGTIFPVILEYDIYNIEPTGKIKTPWHRYSPRAKQIHLNRNLK
ncbi:hypothetical protein NG799_28285 [Laspinema sp. D1]|uniref:Uncharacterized protein n=1 Tax=Laspinema palackyanum D2a TaxID=2953684 RepID=A0ABT2MZN8_9CYAN|nr:hypothetical protein [Laspinema sp. D2a]